MIWERFCIKSGSHMCLLSCGWRKWLFLFMTGISWDYILGSTNPKQTKSCLHCSSSTPHSFKIDPCFNGESRRNAKASWSVHSIQKGTPQAMPHSLYQGKSLAHLILEWPNSLPLNTKNHKFTMKKWMDNMKRGELGPLLEWILFPKIVASSKVRATWKLDHQ